MCINQCILVWEFSQVCWNCAEINIINEKNLDINADTLLLEQKLDLMIYKIYNLLFNEVRMIDPNFSISEAEYNSFEI